MLVFCERISRAPINIFDSTFLHREGFEKEKKEERVQPRIDFITGKFFF